MPQSLAAIGGIYFRQGINGLNEQDIVSQRRFANAVIYLAFRSKKDMSNHPLFIWAKQKDIHLNT